MAKTVLIVDDNVIIRQVLYRLFTSEADFEVCGEAENGQEAIEKAQELHPHLIVMDLAMPVMNGIDASRVLRKLLPTVPLIVFSNYSDIFSEKEAQSLDISAVVSKSAHSSVLLRKARDLARLHTAA
jgi:DNA-binding NarL/FixJ family response regulator